MGGWDSSISVIGDTEGPFIKFRIRSNYDSRSQRSVQFLSYVQWGTGKMQQSLPTPEDQGSNPVVGTFIENVITVTKINKNLPEILLP